MASRSRRWTGSSSTIRMVFGIANAALARCFVSARLWARRVKRLLSLARRGRHGLIRAAPAAIFGAFPTSAFDRTMPVRRAVPVFASAPQASAQPAALGVLPEWDLADLYPAMDSEAFRNDLARAEADCKTFAETYRGRLDALARSNDASAALGTAVLRFEAVEDLIGRLMSYAGLVYSGDTTDPVRAKFYGDTQERLTAASSDLLFFGLELNRIDDAVLNRAMADEPLAHYRPWLEDLRKDKPYQLDDQIEKLFHEKSVTGRAAWNRLFDETIASLRFDVRGEELPIEPTLNKMQDPDESVRKDASDALAMTFRQNLRTFALVTNTLAKDKEISDRWRGFEDVADSRHLANRVEREVVDAMVSAVREAYPRLSHRYYALKAKWFGKDKLDHWDRNAPLPKVDQRTISWNEAKDTVLSAYSDF